jgi:VWFA-related protein
MSPAISRLVVTACVLVPWSAGAHRGQEPPGESQQTFRSAVDVVTIQASVRDARGRPLRGLTVGDFEVRDNGQLRPMLSLRSDLHPPVSLAILVDMSGSMRLGSKVAMAQRALDAVLSRLRPGTDEVGLFTFDSALHERQFFTRDVAVLQGALAEFEPFGTTALYDAAAETARSVAGRSASHKAIVVLTDGIDTSSGMSPSEVSALASAIDVPVYVMATVSSIDQRATLDEGNRRTESADLRHLAEWTGGRLLFATTFPETMAAASSIIDDVRQQYLLAIEAAEGKEWRRLDVRVKRPSAVVKARSGYFGG